MLNTQRRDAPPCATWGRKLGSSYMQCFPQRFSPTRVLWSWHHTEFILFAKRWHVAMTASAPSAIVLKIWIVWLLNFLGRIFLQIACARSWCSRTLATSVAPGWHVALTASALSAQGSVRDPLFFPHCLELSANLVQTYFLTSSGSGRQEYFLKLDFTVNFDFGETVQWKSAQH